MKKAFIIFSLMLIVYGCSPQKKYLEDMGLSVAISYDLQKNKKMLGTNIYHSFEPAIDKPVQIKTATAYTSKGIRESINLESNKKLVSGQIRVVLFGEETAKNGVNRTIDSLIRDPTIGTMIYLAVAEGKGSDILTHQYKEVNNIGSYLYKMLEQNIDGEKLISPTLHVFLQAYYSEGSKDPILPLIRRNNDEVKIVGTALFDKDRMVGTLNMHETFFIKLLKDRFRAGSFEITIPSERLKEITKLKNLGDNVYVSFANLRSNTKIKFLKNEATPTFEIKVVMSIQLNEISNEIDVGNPEILKEIEKKVNTILKAEIEKVLQKVRKTKSDPIGFGKVYRASVREDITKEDCDRAYEDGKINVQLEATILRTGILD